MNEKRQNRCILTQEHLEKTEECSILQPNNRTRKLLQLGANSTLRTFCWCWKISEPAWHSRLGVEKGGRMQTKSSFNWFFLATHEKGNFQMVDVNESLGLENSSWDSARPLRSQQISASYREYYYNSSTSKSIRKSRENRAFKNTYFRWISLMFESRVIYNDIMGNNTNKSGFGNNFSAKQINLQSTLIIAHTWKG